MDLDAATGHSAKRPRYALSTAGRRRAANGEASSMVEHNWCGVLKVFVFSSAPFLARQAGIYVSLFFLQRFFGPADI